MTPDPDRRSLDMRLVPVAAAAWLGAVVGLLSELSVALVAVGVAVLVGVVVYTSRVRAALGCAAATALIAGLSVAASSNGPVAALARERAVVTVQARLDADARVLPARGFLPPLASVGATTEWIDGRGQHIAQRIAVSLMASGDQSTALARIPAGATVLVHGRLDRTDRWDSATAEVRIRGDPQVVSPPGVVAMAVNRVRGGLRDAMRHSPPNQAALVPSLVVGDTTRIDSALVDDFKATGLTHLTAVSGETTTKTDGLSYAESCSMRNLGEGVSRVRRGELAWIDVIAWSAAPHSHEARKECGNG